MTTGVAAGVDREALIMNCNEPDLSFAQDSSRSAAPSSG